MTTAILLITGYLVGYIGYVAVTLKMINFYFSQKKASGADWAVVLFSGSIWPIGILAFALGGSEVISGYLKKETLKDRIYRRHPHLKRVDKQGNGG